MAISSDINLAGIQGGMLQQASRMADAKLNEYLAGRETREVQRAAALGAAQQSVREQEEKARFWAHNQEARRLQNARNARVSELAYGVMDVLPKVGEDAEAGKQVLRAASELFPRMDANAEIEVVRDPKTNQIVKYKVPLKNGGTQDWTPAMIQKRAAQLGATAAQIGQARQTSEDRQAERAEAARKMRQEQEVAYQKSYNEVLDFLRNEQVLSTKKDDVTGEQYPVKADGTRWTPEDEAQLRNQASNVMNTFAATQGATGVAPASSRVINFYREQKALTQAANEKRTRDIQKSLAEISKGLPQTVRGTANRPAPTGTQLQNLQPSQLSQPASVAPEVAADPVYQLGQAVTRAPRSFTPQRPEISAPPVVNPVEQGISRFIEGLRSN